MSFLHLPRTRIMWSGGFDSTYLLISRLLEGERVEAIYITQDLTWQKQIRELEARRRIIHSLPSELRNRLLVPKDIEHLDESTWKLFREIGSELHSITDVNEQTPMLAAVGKAEVGLVVGDEITKNAKAMEFLSRYQVIPTLVKSNVTKQHIQHMAIAKGFDHLLSMTWSCEGTNEEAKHGPCGQCYPCKNRIIKGII